MFCVVGLVIVRTVLSSLISSLEAGNGTFFSSCFSGADNADSSTSAVDLCAIVGSERNKCSRFITTGSAAALQLEAVDVRECMKRRFAALLHKMIYGRVVFFLLDLLWANRYMFLGGRQIWAKGQGAESPPDIPNDSTTKNKSAHLFIIRFLF